MRALIAIYNQSLNGPVSTYDKIKENYKKPVVLHSDCELVGTVVNIDIVKMDELKSLTGEPVYYVYGDIVSDVVTAGHMINDKLKKQSFSIKPYIKKEE